MRNPNPPSSHKMTISGGDIMDMGKLDRLRLVNSLPGFKSANLIGTVDAQGHTNLTVFSSVIHLGSNPPLLGMILRPATVPRHTYENLRSSGYYTVNHIHEGMLEAAHQTSAKYGAGESEFEVCGFTEEYSNCHPAPYVAEARIQIGLHYIEEYRIRANDTRLIVGSVAEVRIREDLLDNDHALNLERAGTLAISGAETYHTTRVLATLPYARPVEQPIKKPTR